MFEQTFRNIDDVLWKEAGCATELDYTEQTSWMLFLKYLDDLEYERSQEAELVGKRYSFIVEPRFRWSAWAAPKKDDGEFDHDSALTGADLIEFVNGELFPYLQGFRERASGPDTIEYKIGEIFSEIRNKFSSGYSLRDALELVDSLSFRSQDQKHELSHLYEAKIRNMGNAGRNGGEYYTPRPLIRAMVRVIDPKIGERIYDAAAGIGRLPLRGARLHALRAGRARDRRAGEAVDRRAGDAADAHVLRQGEEKPAVRDRHHEHDPARHRGAQHPAHQQPDREAVRNPGEGPLRRDPGQPAVRRQGAQGNPAELPGQDRRNGVPVPAALRQVPESRRARRDRDQEHVPVEFRQRGNGARRELLESCNLHTILDCPGGTFLGAGVKTVVLFFEKGESTRKIWYYQLDPGRSLGKTNPLNDDDLADFVEKQKTFADSEQSWTVDINDIDTESFDLSVKNPNKAEEAPLRDPEVIINEIETLDRESEEILEGIRGML